MVNLMRRRHFLAAAVLAAGVPFLSACHLEISNQAESRSPWTRTYTVNASATFDLRNTNGKIRIEAVDGDQISVSADRIAKAGTDDEAKAAAEGMEIKETASADLVALDARQSNTGGLFRGERRVDFVVKVPRALNLRITTTNGTIDIDAVEGSLRLESTNGVITANDIIGGAQAETTNGRITLDFAKSPAGSVTAETTNGEVVINLPRDAKARLAVRVMNGAIMAEDLPLEISEQTRRRLDATMNGGGADIRVETTNGAVRIKGR
jgi:DUF4097 and DUF4098 domain-containing protein YvlB